MRDERRKKERSKQGQTNKQTNKEKQHSTPTCTCMFMRDAEAKEEASKVIQTTNFKQSDSKFWAHLTVLSAHQNLALPEAEGTHSREVKGQPGPALQGVGLQVIGLETVLERFVPQTHGSILPPRDITLRDNTTVT